MYFIVGKFDEELNLVDWQSRFNCQIKICPILFSPATRNDVMHAVALLAAPGVPLHKLSTRTMPVIFLVNLQTHSFVQVLQVRGWQHSLIHVCAQCSWWCNMLWGPTAKLKFHQQFLYTRFGAKPPNLKASNIYMIPSNGQFSREKSFADWWKIQFLWRKLARIAQFCHAKGRHAPKFYGENFCK